MASPAELKDDVPIASDVRMAHGDSDRHRRVPPSSGQYPIVQDTQQLGAFSRLVELNMCYEARGIRMSSVQLQRRPSQRSTRL